MSRALAILVLIWILPLWIAMDRAAQAFTRRQHGPRRYWKRDALQLAGISVVIVLVRPLLPQIGALWWFDLVLMAFALWSVVVNVLIFGVPQQLEPLTAASAHGLRPRDTDPSVKNEHE